MYFTKSVFFQEFILLPPINFDLCVYVAQSQTIFSSAAQCEASFSWFGLVGMGTL